MEILKAMIEKRKKIKNSMKASRDATHDLKEKIQSKILKEQEVKTAAKKVSQPSSPEQSPQRVNKIEFSDFKTPPKLNQSTLLDTPSPMQNFSGGKTSALNHSELK